MNKENNGFTLSELLIVVGIISVLVAICIPIFSLQLEKAREATDLANVRSAYAALIEAVNCNDRTATYNGTALYDSSLGRYSASVLLKQKQKDWQSPVTSLGGVSRTDTEHWIGVPASGGSCTVSYSENEDVKINWGGYTYQESYAWRNYGNSEGGGVGSTLYLDTENSWSKHCSAVNETLDAAIGETIAVKHGDTNLIKYSFGFYAVDPLTNIILFDSGEIKFNSDSTRKIENKLNGSTYAGNVKIYIQLIDATSTSGIPSEVADQLMQLITVTN